MTKKKTKAQMRTRVGVSLDGFIATPDGMPAWDAMPAFSSGSYGIAEFMKQCGAVVMGRTSFDQGFQEWLADWPYKNQQVYVLTSRPLPANVPASVFASKGGPAGVLKQLNAAHFKGDVELLGGSRTIQAFLKLAAIDELGICVLPVLFGKGIPFFAVELATFSEKAWAKAKISPPKAASSRPLFQLDRKRAFPDGAIELVYLPK